MLNLAFLGTVCHELFTTFVLVNSRFHRTDLLKHKKPSFSFCAYPTKINLLALFPNVFETLSGHPHYRYFIFWKSKMSLLFLYNFQSS